MAFDRGRIDKTIALCPLGRALVVLVVADVLKCGRWLCDVPC